MSRKQQAKKTAIERRARIGLLKHERSVGLVTQNVVGMTKSHANLDYWFTTFRQVRTAWTGRTISFYSRRSTWNRRKSSSSLRSIVDIGDTPAPNVELTTRCEAHQPATRRRRHLRNPHSIMDGPTPLWAELWSPHWMAAKFTVASQRFTLLNVYALVERRVREQLFTALASLPIDGDPIMVGGDFNCCLHARVDRSNTATASQGSTQLTGSFANGIRKTFCSKRSTGWKQSATLWGSGTNITRTTTAPPCWASTPVGWINGTCGPEEEMGAYCLHFHARACHWPSSRCAPPRQP